MKKCGKIEEMILGENMELDLVIETDSAVESHTAECAECKAFLEDLKNLSLKIKSVEKIKVSDSFDYKLKLKLEAAKQAEKISETKIVPLFNRIFYYSAGIAAMVVGFFYMSSLGIFENNENGIITVTPGAGLTAETEQVQTPKSTVADSLENMRKTVSDDQELRFRVSTGE
jgi:hypothetical protein